MGWTNFFDVSLDRANDLYTWGWRLSVFGAALTMIGVAALWIGTRVRDRDFEIQMTAANSASSQALERAGTLERDAATIRERAASAELQLEQLRKQVGPRFLGRAFRETLKDQPGANVEILYVRDASDTFSLATQISIEMHGLEGWHVSSPIAIREDMRQGVHKSVDWPAATWVRGQPSGISVVAAAGFEEPPGEIFENKTALGALVRAFLASAQVVGWTGDPDLPPNMLRIVVAPKP